MVGRLHEIVGKPVGMVVAMRRPEAIPDGHFGIATREKTATIADAVAGQGKAQNNRGLIVAQGIFIIIVFRWQRREEPRSVVPC